MFHVRQVPQAVDNLIMSSVHVIAPHAILLQQLLCLIFVYLQTRISLLNFSATLDKDYTRPRVTCVFRRLRLVRILVLET